MATISKPNTFTAGTVIVASEHNSNFDTIYNDYNGNITNANIASGAAIADTKLAQISTASKVTGDALTSLANVPSAAGNLPSANLPDKMVLSATDSVTELTIATGSVTATQSYHTIDTQSDDSTDDLDTISGGTEGMILVIKAANSARTVVVKNGTGNIVCPADVSLDNANDTWAGIYDGTNWLQISSANNGA